MQKIYGRIVIPCAVHEELLDERAGETVVAAVLSATWLEIRSVQNQQLVDELRTRVNIGEAEAIALAVEVEATRLLIDERLGRQAAKDLGLKIIGVLGILLLAKRQNLIKASRYGQFGTVVFLNSLGDSSLVYLCFLDNTHLFGDICP